MERESDTTSADMERLYRERVDYLPDWIWDIDTDGTYTFSNTVVEGILGYTAAEVIGKKVFDLMEPEDAAKCRAVLTEAVRTRRPIRNIIHRGRARDGNPRTLESSCVPIIEDDTLKGFRGISRDIVEEMMFERAAREALANYRAVLESAPTIIVVVQGSRVVYRNPRLIELSGYTAEELASKDPFELVHPDDREYALDLYRRAMLGEAIPIEHYIRAVRKSGETRWLQVRLTVITYNGAPAFLSNSVDITERKAAEEELQASKTRLEGQQEALTDLTKKQVLATSNLEADFREITETAARTSNVERVSLWSYADDHTRIVCRDLYELSKDKHSVGLELTVGDYPSYFAAMEESRVVAHDALSDAYTKEFADNYLRPFGITSMMDAAIRLRGQVVGMACFEHTGPPRHWTSDEVNFAVAVANVAALAVETCHRARAEEERQVLERHMEEQKRSFYRQTIWSVTDGKLEICDESDVEPYISKSMLEADLRCVPDIPAARHRFEAFCRENGLGDEDLSLFKLGVGEAMTNAIKHGVDGRAYAGRTNGEVWVGVTDRGTGIESLILPKAVLARGFSTKPSLGLGYSIMLDVADRILLATGDKGTTVVLIKALEHALPSMSIEQLPDTWSSLPECRNAA